MFMTVTWLPDGNLVLGPSKGAALRIDPATGNEQPQFDLQKDAPWPATLQQAPDGGWLLGSFVSDSPVLYGAPGAMQQIAAGVSPTLSPDGGWVAYFKGDTLRLVRTDGSGDRALLDLAPLGGRDRHFASTPDCFPDRNDSCSYRPPVLSWAAP
jgi:hypothetical protein